MIRIVKEEMSNGGTRYVVETNRLFGFIPCGWHTVNIPYPCGEDTIELPAIFGSEEEARRYCQPEPYVVKKEVLK